MRILSCVPLKGLALVVVSLATAPRLTGQCYSFTHEHVDLLSIIWNAPSNQLSLLASDDDHGQSYASNQCVVVCPESARFTLPAGTPFGREGDPLWILPQSSYAGMPFVGVSAEAIPSGTFADPLTIQLNRIEGPGQFIVWQSGSFGEFDLKMDSRDGIGPGDKFTPFAGGHEHHNWGFTTSGVYRVYFQAVARHLGETTNRLSAETPFTFHVLPLNSFETWTATNWPCECRTNILLAGANPDGDTVPNAIEYAFGSDPTVAGSTDWPTASLVSFEGQSYGALTYTRAKAATDVVCEVVASGDLGASSWETLTTIHEIEDLGGTERITVRDIIPAGSGTQRFYMLRVRLN